MLYVCNIDKNLLTKKKKICIDSLNCSASFSINSKIKIQYKSFYEFIRVCFCPLAHGLWLACILQHYKDICVRALLFTKYCTEKRTMYVTHSLQNALCYQIYASCDILKLYNLVRKHTRIILNLYLFTKLK
jgi:hypothetical protein